jgi:hypothetical protein
MRFGQSALPACDNHQTSHKRLRIHRAGPSPRPGVCNSAPHHSSKSAKHGRSVVIRARNRLGSRFTLAQECNSVVVAEGPTLVHPSGDLGLAGCSRARLSRLRHLCQYHAALRGLYSRKPRHLSATGVQIVPSSESLGGPHPPIGMRSVLRLGYSRFFHEPSPILAVQHWISDPHTEA